MGPNEEEHGTGSAEVLELQKGPVKGASKIKTWEDKEVSERKSHTRPGSATTIV